MYSRSSSRLPSFNYPNRVNSVMNAGKVQEDPREMSKTSPRVISEIKNKAKKFPRRGNRFHDDVELKPVV